MHPLGEGYTPFEENELQTLWELCSKATTPFPQNLFSDSLRMHVGNDSFHQRACILPTVVRKPMWGEKKGGSKNEGKNRDSNLLSISPVIPY